MECLFCKIVNGDIPCDKIYEDDKVLAFLDISPKAPKHILIIPKQHIATLNELNEPELAGHLMVTASKIAKQEGIAEDGYRFVVNCNEHGGQEVYHLHLHILGGRRLEWPPG